jgi:hypothetical protein
MGRLVKEKSQITAGDFKGGLRQAGFAVEDGRIEDVRASVILMRRTLTRPIAPILSSLIRISTVTSELMVR